MTIVGLDIGGANIKAADQQGQTLSRPFAIWRHPERLAAEVASILRSFPGCDGVALTMTAELADCFTTKAEGVTSILDSVEAGMRDLSNATTSHDLATPAAKLSVWTTRGRFVDAQTAREQTEAVAAANWHALATWCGQFSPAGSGLLVDIGTTTTDLIPLHEGRPVSLGLTDLSRLQSGELSYSGIRRTPICALAHSVPFRDGYCPLAAEIFATTLDLYLLLGDLAEDANDLETANGKPATRAEARHRIVRMLCSDGNAISQNEAIEMARFLADVQRQRLAGSLERVLARQSSPCQTVLVSGSGEFLARRLVKENRKTATAKIISLKEKFSDGIAEAACAYAVAQLCHRGDHTSVPS
ncbi:hydantoinase/oxoprolinase family protein [Schlesneria sp. DSM 10557]|uniref:hydantoinase/oxoprolinase family protein n=1 Tax=Schlesneria sp. DSM 10557 TaxID=3044399 RepID=UPI0035A1A0B0